MGCCGSKDDYYTVTPYRPPHEKPHPSVYHQYQRQPERYNPPRRRDPRREEAEKRQRQAQATAAAQNYGWPTARGVPSNTNHHPRGTGSRDSIIEPDLAGGLAAMPGSDFRAVYDPQRHRQRQRPRQQPIRRPNPTPPFQRPPYYQQRFVTQQPTRMPMMTAAPGPNIGRAVPRVHMPATHPVIARKPVIQDVRTQIYATPQVARLVRRRDSNGISVCSDDSFDREDLRQYTVSPIERSYRGR